MRWFVVFVTLLTSVGFVQVAAAQDRYVELEILSAGVAELGAQQRVMETLSDVGADRVSVRSARGAPRPEVTETDAGRTTVIRIVGVLDGRSIRLPGGNFSLRDTAGIKSYIKKLKDDGATVALAEKQAFGLTANQLVATFEELAAEVNQGTKGQPSNQVISQLLGNLQKEVGVTRAANRIIDSRTPVLEEYQGLATGTALAGVLRPLGLVLAPRREQGKKLQFVIAVSNEVEEHWPVGWPIEVAPLEAAPKMFEKLDQVEIQEFGLKDSLDAIQGRVGVPFLYDQNGIARAGIEMNDVKVTLVRDRMMYFSIVRKLLNQSRPKLSLEIRNDENGKPFVWISPQQ